MLNAEGRVDYIISVLLLILRVCFAQFKDVILIQMQKAMMEVLCLCGGPLFFSTLEETAMNFISTHAHRRKHD